MPSSVRVGSRPPRSSLIFSYSSGVRPCSRIISGVTDGIAEVVMTGKFYCRILGEFLHADLRRVLHPLRDRHCPMQCRRPGKPTALILFYTAAAIVLDDDQEALEKLRTKVE